MVDGAPRVCPPDLDRRLFHHLRMQVDAVMVGAGTARTERYGRITKSDELRAKRVAEGLAADPLAVIVSGRLALPLDCRSSTSPNSRS